MAAPSDEYPLTITKEVDRCGAAALVALSANLLDVVLGFGDMGIIV
jgi:hypothetical protein